MTIKITRRTFQLGTLAAAAIALTVGAGAAQAAPDRIGLDYAYYNPVSLLLKDKGWVEEEFKKDGIDVRWVLSLGSNKALEYLNGGSIQFGSTAGGAALVGKANGNPIKAIYIYSRPEWTALVTGKDSGIKSVADLKGKRVAVTRGTDPHLFLLQALNQAGLTEKDIKPVLLQHPDGGRALVSGQVDAWAGLDPHMAKHELQEGARLFHRDPALNTYGVLNVREDFATENPEIVERLLKVYERARKYSLENPDELRSYLVKAAKVEDEIARKQLGERTDLTNPVIGEEHRKALTAAGTVLKEIGVLKPDTDVPALVADLIDDQYIQRVNRQQAAQR
ncbi:aliphatic sulfonate ABC transporter substrate-binding protein [Oceanibaculum nanhaiense]|jgi:sulfonate transport system substrate-binding protein|uniref:aliphatic sulfonate ABC transporter substrate-binding protein n=1 Tax=Oceanibaculum nanhaiense TaxID=1909734 RepID=UPI000A3D44ED|nr:aliphatic sulfonate ABC transporter substrate-binding protein [Oceanibaculum nanhaiense]